MHSLVMRLGWRPLLLAISAMVWFNACAVAADTKPMRPKALAVMAAQAITAFRSGEFLRAIELYRQLVTANPADALSWQLLGQSLAGANDPRGAKEAYLRSLKAQPEGLVATATKELLTKLPAPDPKSVKVDAALTLADWLPLAEEMVRQDKRAYVLEQNGKILAEQGELPQLLSLQDRLVREMLSPLPLTDLDRAREILAAARQIKHLVPGNLTVLRYEGMACHMLSNFECAEANYAKWMQLATHTTPERGMISRLLLQARQRTALNASEDITRLGITVLAMSSGDVASEGEKQLWVQSVASGEIGERLGLQVGDVILKAGDGAPAAAAQLQSWADSRKGPQSWGMEVQREGKSLKLALTPSREELALVADEAFRQYFAGTCEPAAARLQELTTLQPDDPLPWLLLGECRQGNKDAAGARDAFTKAMQLGKDSKVGKEAKAKLAALPQPDPFTVKLDNGLTLGDWVTLQRNQLSSTPPEKALAEARGYVLRYGPIPALAALEKDLVKSEQDEARREVETALGAIRVRNVAEAEAAFPKLVKLKAIKPDLPSLLRLEARTCHLIKFFSCAEAAYAEWLLAAPADDPRRRDMIEALFQAQQGKPLPDSATSTGQTVKHCDDCPLMIVIEPGSFDMGKPGRGLTVRFEKPFAIARTEVTQRQWQRLMGGNPSEFGKCGPDCPVENVSWNAAQEYVKRLASETGKPYRLPSEAEWEAACRAGEDDDYCGGSDIAEIAWYGAYGHDGGNSGKTTHPVANRRPNAWGLHDMSGNVREWVADSWQPDLSTVPANGSARADNSPRKVVKGGSWVSKPAELKASHRDWDMATDRFYFTGFRVAVTLER